MTIGAPGAHGPPSAREAVVVGASASGLFAASRLAEAGVRTSVLERCNSLDPAPRTLIVTHRLDEYVNGITQDVVVNQINRFELYADGKIADVELGAPDLIIERNRLINALAERATDRGVTIELGTRFDKIVGSNGSLELQSSSQGGDPEIRHAHYLVGADGANSRVARAAGWPRQPTVSLVQALVERPPDLPVGTSRVWFRPQDTPYFYWLIPDRDGRAALGVIGTNGPAIRQRLDAFLEEQSLKAAEYQGAIIPAYERWIPPRKRFDTGHVYLVGDAAGHVKVSTVGGIVTGFRGAAAATDMILHGRRSSARALRGELFVHLVLRKVLSAFSEDDYRYLIGGLDERSKASLSRRDRDEALRAAMGFIRTRPGVVLRAIRALMVAR